MMNNNDLSVPACRHHARMDGWIAKCQGGKCLPQKKQTQPAADSQKGKRRPFSSSYALELLDTLVSGVHLYINNPPLSLCAYAYTYLSLSRQTLLVCSFSVCPRSIDFNENRYPYGYFGVSGRDFRHCAISDCAPFGRDECRNVSRRPPARACAASFICPTAPPASCLDCCENTLAYLLHLDQRIARSLIAEATIDGTSIPPPNLFPSGHRRPHFSRLLPSGRPM